MKITGKISALLISATLAILLACGSETTGAKGHYTCSMHPQVIQAEPGNCPICAMSLTYVPAKEETKNAKDTKAKEHNHSSDEKDHDHDATFRFSLGESLLSGNTIATVPAKRESFTREATYSGHIDYNEDPSHMVVVNTKYDGWIESLHVAREGQRVRRGAPLMGIYSQKIFAAKEEYLSTYTALKDLYQAEARDMALLPKDTTLGAAKKRLLNLDISPGEIARLEKTGITQRQSIYRSPISGVVIKKNVLQGQHIRSGQELFRIANLSRLWILIHIFEKDLPYIKKGQVVSVESSAYPGKKFRGTIDLIYPFFDMKNRDAKVRIILKNRNNALRPGMFVNVKSRLPLRGKVITIPDNAIIYSGEENYVFVDLGEGNFELRPVTVKMVSSGKAIIAKGLKKGESVVANGQFLLDSEASLKKSLQRMGK